MQERYKFQLRGGRKTNFNTLLPSCLFSSFPGLYSLLTSGDLGSLATNLLCLIFMHASIQQTFIDSLYVPDSVQALGNQWWITQIWPLLQQTWWVSLEEICPRYMCLQMFIPLSVEMVCLTQNWTSLPHTQSKLIKHQIFIRQSDNSGSIKKNKTWFLFSSSSQLRGLFHRIFPVGRECKYQHDFYVYRFFDASFNHMDGAPKSFQLGVIAYSAVVIEYTMLKLKGFTETF